MTSDHKSDPYQVWEGVTLKATCYSLKSRCIPSAEQTQRIYTFPGSLARAVRTKI